MLLPMQSQSINRKEPSYDHDIDKQYFIKSNAEIAISPSDCGCKICSGPCVRGDCWGLCVNW
jgi:hypothetical protein